MSKNHKYPPSQNYTCQQKIRATVTVIFVPTHIHEDKFGFLVWLLKLFQYAWRQTGNSIKCSTCLTDTNTATGNIKNIKILIITPTFSSSIATTSSPTLHWVSTDSLQRVLLVFSGSLDSWGLVLSALLWESVLTDAKMLRFQLWILLQLGPSYSFQVGVIRAIVTGAGNRLFDAPQWQERCQALQENSSSSFIRPM